MIFRMLSLPPPNCQPLKPYRWVRTDSLIVQLIIHTFPWYNWRNSKILITSEIMTNRSIRYSFAEKGFWIKYFVQNVAAKVPVEIFIRVVPLEEI